MTFINAALLSSTLLSHSVIEPCPPVHLIKEKNVTHIQGGGMDRTYYVYQVDHYGLKDLYMFVIGDIIANSEEEAFKIAQRALGTLEGPPITFIDDGRWACEYKIKNYRATTITPVEF